MATQTENTHRPNGGKDLNEQEDNGSQARELISERSSSACGAGCVKYWALIVGLFLVFYGICGGFFVGLIAAVVEDAEATLIAYIVIFLVTITLIVAGILWGHFTNQLEKIEAEAKQHDYKVVPNITT